MLQDAPMIPERMKMLERLLAVALAGMLAACGTTSVGLKYSADATVAKASPTAPPLIVGNFSDDRGKPANYLGAIRGGFGNPLKTLESDRPVGELVNTAFADGLRARGATVDTGTAQHQIVGTIKRLDCSQLVRREAHVEIDVAVIDKAGQRRFSKTYNASTVAGAVVAVDTGVFASVEDLRVVLEKTLRETVDKALDDPQLRAALQL